MSRNTNEDDYPRLERSSRFNSRSNSQMFIIQIEALTGQLYELRCNSIDSVWSVKARLARSEGILISQQHLIFAGKELKDSDVLKDVGVRRMSKLRLVVSMRGGPINTRVVDEDIDDYSLDDLQEAENAFAVLVVKDGEKLNLVRLNVGREHQATTSNPFEQSPTTRSPDNQRAVENRRTFQKMQVIRSKMNNRRNDRPELPTLVPSARSAQNAEKYTSLPPIYPPNLPVSNIHSQFLRRYGLAPSRLGPENTDALKPAPPLIQNTPPKAHRPRCSKCGKRLALTEQYQCKCGLKYCSRHRYAEEHACKFDYQKENKQRLAASNAAVNGPRLPKI